MKILTQRALCLLTLTLVLASAVVTRGQDVQTSCADCANLRAAFSIENKTGVTIPYQVKWGSNHPWKSISLASGRVETHSYPLSENGRAPSPYIRYDRIGGDGAVTLQEFHMTFYAAGYAGYGAKPSTREPKKYYFEYAADRKTLTLFAY